MSVKKIEIRPKGDGTYSDILYPKTSVDMVDGAVSDSEFTTHEADDANPHGVTAQQTGAYYSGNTNIAKRDLSKYQTVKSAKDSEGMFAIVEYKTKVATPVLVMKSTLSGGTSPQYTTRTEEWYASDGTTITETIAYLLTYDADGDLISEV